VTSNLNKIILRDADTDVARHFIMCDLALAEGFDVLLGQPLARAKRLRASSTEALPRRPAREPISNPVRVVANTSESGSRDVSAIVASELQQPCLDQMRDLPAGLQEFVERYGGPGELMPARSDRQVE
jgi:hypothetical protein